MHCNIIIQVIPERKRSGLTKRPIHEKVEVKTISEFTYLILSAFDLYRRQYVNG